MTTLTLLKSRVADDLLRTDLTSQIANAISDAINYWQETRFFFTESRTATFATVAAQSAYTSADDADIPLVIDLDTVVINDGDTDLEMTLTDPVYIQLLLSNSVGSTVPSRYSYYQETFRLYPAPDAAYTVRLFGQFEIAEPATDSEANNVWMTKGFELIRATAKGLLAAHTLKDPGMQIAMFGAEGVPNQNHGMVGSAAQKLLRQSSKKNSTGYVTPTQF